MPDVVDENRGDRKMKWLPGQEETVRAHAKKIAKSGMNREQLIASGLVSAPVPWGELQQTLLIAYELKQAREQAGMTINDIAARSGIDKSQISKLENGLSNPTIETLSRYLSALGKRFRLVLEDCPA